jgi:hypothetical protein
VGTPPWSGAEARIIDSVDVEPATLRARIADFEAQRELAASTDFPPSE